MVRVIGLDEGGKGRDLVTTPTSAWYAGGHFLFVRDNMLMAQAFDPVAIGFTGDAFPVAEDVVVRSLTGVGVFSTTDAGDLLYQTGSRDAGSILQWFDRQGNPAGTIADEAYYNHVVLSPDGSTAAVRIIADQQPALVGQPSVRQADLGQGHTLAGRPRHVEAQAHSRYAANRALEVDLEPLARTEG